MKKWILNSFLAMCLLLVGLLMQGNGLAASSHFDQSLAQYQFSETKSLVRFVHKAAKLFHKEGVKAFPRFRDRKGKWFKKDRYLFIYDLNGVNVFHASEPELQGKNLLGFKDLDGKPVIQIMVDIAKDKKQSNGWVHYLWAEPDHLSPVWKTSYVERVTDPSGKAYLIGSGIYGMRIEKEFIRRTVDRAASMLKENGLSSLKSFTHKGEIFRFNDTSLFVLDMKGNVVFDPAFPDYKSNEHIGSRRNLLDLKDDVGHYTIRTVIDKMKNQDSAWVMYVRNKPNQSKLAKKLMYVKRVTVDNKVYIVGSDLYIETPIWMKD